MWPRNPLKRHFKIELENKSCNNVCVLLSLSFGTPLDTLWGVFSRLLGVSALKKARFSQAWGPGLGKGGVSPCLGPLALQKYCVFFSRAPRATQKTTIWHACPWFWASGHPKESPSNRQSPWISHLTNSRAQERSKQTHHHHWVITPRRSGRSPLGLTYMCIS